MGTFFSGHEIVDMAVATEEKGHEFYKTAELNARSEEIKQLFAYLADEELNHKKIFIGLKSYIDDTPQGVPIDWEDVGKYIKAMVESSLFLGGKSINFAVQAETDKEAVKFALEFEKDTLLFFYQLKDVMKSSGIEVVDKIINEEKEHIKRLTEMKRLM